MVDGWQNCPACTHRYGVWVSACPKCGAKNEQYKAKPRTRGQIKYVAIGAGVGAVAVFAILVIVGWMASQDSDTNIAPIPTRNTVDRGTPLTIDGVSYNVVRVSATKSLGFWGTADGMYLIASLELENISGVPKLIRDDHIALVDNQQRIFSSNSAAAFYSDWLTYKEINPGLKSTGTMVFDVPANNPSAEYSLAIGYNDGRDFSFIRLGPLPQ